MALNLCDGGRERVANASIGKLVGQVNLYLAFYTDKLADGTPFPHQSTPDDPTLDSFKDWEVNTPGTGNYSRTRIDDDTFTISYSPTGLIQAFNSAEIRVDNITPARSIPGSVANSIKWAAIVKQASANGTTARDVIAIGTLASPVDIFNAGDNLVVPANNLIISV